MLFKSQKQSRTKPVIESNPDNSSDTFEGIEQVMPIIVELIKAVLDEFQNFLWLTTGRKYTREEQILAFHAFIIKHFRRDGDNPVFMEIKVKQCLIQFLEGDNFLSMNVERFGGFDQEAKPSSPEADKSSTTKTSRASMPTDEEMVSACET